MYNNEDLRTCKNLTRCVIWRTLKVRGGVPEVKTISVCYQLEVILFEIYQQTWLASVQFDVQLDACFFYGTLMHIKILTRVLGHSGNNLEILDADLEVSAIEKLS